MKRLLYAMFLVGTLALLPMSDAVAHHKSGHSNGGGNGGGGGSDNGSEVTEDNDQDGVPNNIPDDGDNQHPSGNDKSVENGNSGNQGNSQSDPDGMSNGGADKPGGTGGVDQIDQDGNNGCGNDDDFEDDNNGNCGGPDRDDDGGSTEEPGGSTEEPGTVDEPGDAVGGGVVTEPGNTGGTGGTGGNGGSTVSGGTATIDEPVFTPSGTIDNSVVGETGLEAAPETGGTGIVPSAVRVLGAVREFGVGALESGVLPKTGEGLTTLLAISLFLMASGAMAMRAGKTR